MFQNMTYENILADMLSRVTSDIDKREGSIIHDAIGPAAYKLAEIYFQLVNYTDLFFVDTSVGEYLDRKALDYGITRKTATKALRKIETTGVVDIGTRWGINGLIYTVKEFISTNKYLAECEQYGIIGNLSSGVLENIDNVSGVTATITDVLSSGLDEETDDALRGRIKQYLINPSQDGNVSQYLKWATEYNGVGAAKVFPLWNGANTVKVAITNGLYLPAETLLVNEFQKYMDPGSTGLGNGVAPIGSKVTVVSGTKKDINVTANVILAEGYSEPTGAGEAISEYLKSIVYLKNSVSYMRIGSALLDCPSITDVNNLTVNGGVIDVPIVGDEIPALNSSNLTVVS